MKKKLTALVLALVMCVGLAVPAFAQEYEESALNVFEAGCEAELAIREKLIDGETVTPSEAYQLGFNYLDADIRDAGITAAIDANGRLQIRQIVTPSVSTRAAAQSELICSTFLLLDSEGQELSANQIYANAISKDDIGSLSDYSIYAELNAYYDIKYAGEITSSFYLNMNHMTTTIAYGTSAYQASRIEHKYFAREKWGAQEITKTNTVYSPTAGAYTWNPQHSAWYANYATPGGCICAYSTIVAYGKMLTLSCELTLTDTTNPDG